MSDYYEAAKRAINRLFSDTSVSQGETKRSLKALRDEIDIYMETLEDDIGG